MFLHRVSCSSANRTSMPSLVKFSFPSSPRRYLGYLSLEPRCSPSAEQSSEVTDPSKPQPSVTGAFFSSISSRPAPITGRKQYISYLTTSNELKYTNHCRTLQQEKKRVLEADHPITRAVAAIMKKILGGELTQRFPVFEVPVPVHVYEHGKLLRWL